MRPRSKKILKISLLSLGLVVVAVATYFVVQIGPYNIYGMLRYDQRREGDLRVGHKAPDVVLTALDGVTPVRLHDRTGGRPTVLIFGSYT
jgi:hypothetical protein